MTNVLGSGLHTIFSLSFDKKSYTHKGLISSSNNDRNYFGLHLT